MGNLLNHSKLFIKKNASTIMTCMGAAGVVVTSVMAIKATPKALERIEQAKEEKGEDLTKLEIINTAGVVYIPTFIMGASTIACIVGANVLNKKKQAALMSAYALLDSSYKEYKKKTEELYGEDAHKNIVSEIAKDKYEPTENEGQLFYDEYSGRYFTSTMENVIKAEYEFNRLLAQDSGLYLNEWFELVGLDRTDYGDYLGWSVFELVETYWYCWVEFQHEKVVMDDGMECYIITMLMEPTFDFENY